MIVMKRTAPDGKICAALKQVLCLVAWLLLYGAPTNLFRAGFADGTHVVFEGLAALSLGVLYLRDRSLPRGRGSTGCRHVFLVLVPAAVLGRLASGIFLHAGTPLYMRDVDAALGPGMYKWYVLRTCVTAPLMEEVGCRWIAFGRTRRHAGFWPSALLSAAMFSLIHASVNPRLVVSVIPGAFLRCLVYELTGKLRWCVAEHMAYNMLCLPAAPWVTPRWANRYAGVPREAGVPVLAAVTALMVLLCAFRKRVFRGDGGGRGDFPKDPGVRPRN